MAEKSCNHLTVEQIHQFDIVKHAVAVEIGYCDECGNMVAAYMDEEGGLGVWKVISKLRMRRVRLTKGLAGLLVKLHYEVRRSGKNELDMGYLGTFLTPSQYNSVQQLRYWGLLHHPKNDAGESIVGKWLITRNGARFLKSDMTMPRSVWVANNKVRRKDEDDQVSIAECLRQTGINHWDQKDDIIYDLAPAEPKQVGLF